MDSGQLRALVVRASEHDHEAWERLVAEYDGMLWAVANRFRLDHAQRADAVQTTWVRLFEHLSEVRQTERLAGWLATTLRRECLRTLRQTRREQTTEDWEGQVGRLPGGDPSDSTEPGPERRLLAQERLAIARRALAGLAPEQRRLIDLVVCRGDASYDELAVALGMPRGSIGPTRARILKRLRSELEAAGLSSTDVA